MEEEREMDRLKANRDTDREGDKKQGEPDTFVSFVFTGIFYSTARQPLMVSASSLSTLHDRTQTHHSR
jgi:hypothetical protein